MEYGLKDKIIISSFNHFTIKRMKEVCPDMKCGLLTETWMIDAGAYTANLGVECLHPIWFNMIGEQFDEVKAHGLDVNVWTVNEEEDIRTMMNRGVTSIIGNFPDRITKVRAEG